MSENQDKEKSGKIARNFLYMFEFVVDDLLITRQNLCAPEEYPTCTEITFRSSVYVSICDREVGCCVNPSSPKCGKCALFTLESPITDKDKLLVHVYKKRTESCKFLIGLTEVAIKPIFDRVKESFDAENPNWENAMLGHVAQLPRMKGPNSKGLLDNCSCYEKLNERHEQWCPTSELSKRLLPLFNLCKMQTGNIVIIMRLVCNGPTIVSSFPFSRICSRNPKSPPPCPPGEPCDPCDPCGPSDPCAAAATATGGPMNKSNPCCPPPPTRKCRMADPCAPRVEPVAKCLRYYACNVDKLCPTDYCEDEFDRECPTVPTKRCPPSPIEKKLQKCGPCGGIQPHPRFIQERQVAEQLGKSKDDTKDKNGKNGKDDKGKDGKKRQKGGAVNCVGDLSCPSAVYEVGCEPVCEGALQANKKTRIMQTKAATELGRTCESCQANYNVACEDARKRAIRKLRHLMLKYNIQIDK
ncbi:uncharacterized protein LOC110187310 [Drosophila serrata]|uniref:uncharacterized protein LOC110187310 n=1 Tax=Drosophila serrata TaxID=7274 RepID=UPI000A1CF7C2|nr:uncharacterized protein LOC110187310 [Drosophila serrata]